MLIPSRGSHLFRPRFSATLVPVRIVQVGPHALLVEVEDAGVAAALAAWVRRQDARLDEVVPAARTVLLDGVRDPDAVRRLLTQAPMPALAAHHDDPAALVEIPVRYDGDDLDFVARRWGTDAAGVIARHGALRLVSAFCGFAPGFAYLAGLPEELAVPRLATPRPRLRAGAVALADTWCAVYPCASPGGWRVLGHTETVVWDVDRDPPALLAPGTRVRFVAR